MCTKSNSFSGRQRRISLDHYLTPRLSRLRVNRKHPKVMRIDVGNRDSRKGLASLPQSNTSVNGRPMRHSLVRRKRSVNFQITQTAQFIMNHGHPSRTTHKNQACKITPFDVRFIQHQLDGHESPFKEVFGQFFEFFPIHLRANPLPLIAESNRNRLTLGQCMLGLICLSQ